MWIGFDPTLDLDVAKAEVRTQPSLMPEAPALAVQSLLDRCGMSMDDMAVGYLPGRGALNPDGSEAPEPVTVARAPFLAAQRGDKVIRRVPS